MSEMTTHQMQNAPAGAPVEESPSFMSRVINVFAAPSQAFSGMTNKWEGLIAALVVAGLGFGAHILQAPYLGPDLKKAALENIEKFKDQMPAEQYEEMRESIGTQIEDGMNLTPMTIGVGLLAVVFSIFVISLFAWMAGNFFQGGKLPLWQVMTVVAFTGFIGLVGSYATGAMMTMKGSSYVYIGLGMLKPVGDGSFVYYLLRQMEFVTMWKIAALCIGLGAIYQKPGKSFAFVIVPLWLIFISLVAGANLFTGGTIVY